MFKFAAVSVTLPFAEEGQRQKEEFDHVLARDLPAWDASHVWNGSVSVCITFPLGTTVLQNAVPDVLSQILLTACSAAKIEKGSQSLVMHATGIG